MAKLSDDSIFKGLSGTIGKQLVFKQYGDKTVVAAYPDMSKVKPSMLQTHNRGIFKEAVAYAKAILCDPERKQAYAQKVAKGKSIYRFAIKEYLRQQKK